MRGFVGIKLAGQSKSRRGGGPRGGDPIVRSWIQSVFRVIMFACCGVVAYNYPAQLVGMLNEGEMQ